MADEQDKRSRDVEALNAMAGDAEGAPSEPPAQQLADLDAQSREAPGQA